MTPFQKVVFEFLKEDVTYDQDSIRYLADKFEVPPSTVYRWANGTGVPHPDAQKRIMDDLSLMGFKQEPEYLCPHCKPSGKCQGTAEVKETKSE